MSKRSLGLLVAVLVFTKAHAPESASSSTPFAVQTPTIATPVFAPFGFAALKLDLDEYELEALELKTLNPSSLDIAMRTLFPWENADRTYFVANHALEGEPLLDEGELSLSRPLATSSIASGFGGTSRSRGSRGQLVASNVGGSASSPSLNAGNKSVSSSTSAADSTAEDERGEPPQDTESPSSQSPSSGAEPNDGANDTDDRGPSHPVDSLPNEDDGSSATTGDDAPGTIPADGGDEDGSAPPEKTEADEPHPMPIWKDPSPPNLNPPNATTPVQVPLPGTLPLFVVGLAAFGLGRWRRKSRRSV